MVYIIAYEAGVEHDFPFNYEYMNINGDNFKGGPEQPMFEM